MEDFADPVHVDAIPWSEHQCSRINRIDFDRDGTLPCGRTSEKSRPRSASMSAARKGRPRRTGLTRRDVRYCPKFRDVPCRRRPDRPEFRVTRNRCSTAVFQSADRVPVRRLLLQHALSFRPFRLSVCLRGRSDIYRGGTSDRLQRIQRGTAVPMSSREASGF